MFIEDHRKLLQDGATKLRDEDVLTEIGLDSSSAARKKIVQNITKSQQQASQKNNLIHDFTLKCEYHPNPLERSKGSVLPKPKVVGYLYFRTPSPKDGDRIVVSHLKVHGDHQGKGLGHLLLMGMCHQVDSLDITASVLDLQVMDKNIAAKRLYTKLGFTETKRTTSTTPTTKTVWITMQCKVPFFKPGTTEYEGRAVDSALDMLATRWYKRLEEKSLSEGSGAKGGKRQRQEETSLTTETPTKRLKVVDDDASASKRSRLLKKTHSEKSPSEVSG
jgi:ribosomal protein S18 acetylase RimI-like enzyme